MESRQLRWRHIHYRHQKVGERIPGIKTFGIMGCLIIVMNIHAEG